MRNIFICVIILGLISNLSAQEAGKYRVGFNIATGSLSTGIGMQGADIDLRYNFNDHINYGLKLGIQANSKLSYQLENYNYVNVVSDAASFLVHSDYYFFHNYSRFTPFVGAGIGGYALSTVAYTTDLAPSLQNYPSTYKIGAMIRGGVEYRRLRLTFERNQIPNSVLINTNHQNIGSYSNSFSNLSLGFYFGGGKMRAIRDTISYSSLSFRSVYSSLFGKDKLAAYHFDSLRNVNAKFHVLGSISVAGFPGSGFRYRANQQFSTDLELGIIPADGGGVLCNWSLNYHVPKCAGLISGMTYSRVFLYFDSDGKIVKNGFDQDIVSAWVGYLFPSILFSPVNFTVRLGPAYSQHENYIYPYIYLGIGIPAIE